MKTPLAYPVRYRNGVIRVLDETRLPFEETYIEVRTLKEALVVLKEMKTRAFGQVLLYFYTCLLMENIEHTARAFKQVRPTFDFYGLAEMLKDAFEKTGQLKAAIEGIVNRFEKMRRQRAKRVAEALPPDAHVLTICHVSGELVYVGEAVQTLGKSVCFYASETRPYLQGTRLTFWELQRAGIPVKLLCDNQAAWLMENGVVNAVITGSDRSNIKGDIINKIGTYALALLAHHHGIPVYALVQRPKEVELTQVKIERRPEQEVFMWLKKRGYLPPALYPAFDLTPARLITKHFDFEEGNEA